MELASHHKLGIVAETGPSGARAALVTIAQRPKPAELAVRAHRMPAAPAVSSCLREQTGGGEKEREERKVERTGRGGGCSAGDKGVGGEESLKSFLFVFLLVFYCDLLAPVFIIHHICLE